MSSLLLVLLLLVLGSLTLQGLSVQHQAQVVQSSLEQRAIREGANAESLLEWGRMVAWPPRVAEQCQSAPAFMGRVCLRIFPDDTTLLIASSGEQTRWLTGRLSEGQLQFDHNGWSDFCPRRESSQCLIP